MPAPLSFDIRRRFQKLMELGLSGREAARRLMISPATGVRLAAKVRRGETLVPAKQGRPPRTGKIFAHETLIRSWVEQDPDITLFELRDALAAAEGVKVHHSSIANALRRMGFTFKKNRWWPRSKIGPTSGAPGWSG